MDINIIWVAPVVAVLVATLSRPPIAKALRGLVGNRKELVLFALFEAVAIVATTLLLMAFGPQAGGLALLGFVALFTIWAMKPPAKPR